jgi:hypothetical protein
MLFAILTLSNWNLMMNQGQQGTRRSGGTDEFVRVHCIFLTVAVETAQNDTVPPTAYCNAMAPIDCDVL